MPVFWLMERDLVSPRGSAASTSRFWGVYGFSMPSVLGSVRCIYFCSCFKGALSSYRHCPQPPTCPWDHCLSFSALRRWMKLAGLGRVWLSSRAVCVAETCMGSPGLVSASQGLWRSSRLPGPSPCVSGLMALASSHRLPSFSRSLCAFLPAVLRGLCVLPKFVRLPCLCTPGLPSVQGLCGLLGVVCCTSLSYLGPPSVLKGLCALVTFVSLSEAYSQSPSPLSGWGHNL